MLQRRREVSTHQLAEEAAAGMTGAEGREVRLGERGEGHECVRRVCVCVEREREREREHNRRLRVLSVHTVRPGPQASVE